MAGMSKTKQIASLEKVIHDLGNTIEAISTTPTDQILTDAMQKRLRNAVATYRRAAYTIRARKENNATAKKG